MLRCTCNVPKSNGLTPHAVRCPPQGWGENDRGVSYTFGPDSVTEFLQKHDLDLVCRAHQVRGLACVCGCACARLWFVWVRGQPHLPRA